MGGRERVGPRESWSKERKGVQRVGEELGLLLELWWRAWSCHPRRRGCGMEEVGQRGGMGGGWKGVKGAAHARAPAKERAGFLSEQSQLGRFVDVGDFKGGGVEEQKDPRRSQSRSASAAFYFRGLFS